MDMPNTQQTTPNTPWLRRIVTGKDLALAVGWLIALVLTATQLWDRYHRATGPQFAVEASQQKFTPPVDDVLTKMGVGDIGRLKDINGVLVVTIKNTGELDAENVIFDAKDSGYAVYLFDDESGDVVEFNRRFDIGTIHSEQSVTVIVWGKDNSFYQDGTPLIIHEHGQQRVYLPGGADFPLSIAFVVSAAVLSGLLGGVTARMLTNHSIRKWETVADEIVNRQADIERTASRLSQEATQLREEFGAAFERDDTTSEEPPDP